MNVCPGIIYENYERYHLDATSWYLSSVQREFIVAFSKQVTIFILLTMAWGHSVVAFTQIVIT
jgi:hypothetical protein